MPKSDLHRTQRRKNIALAAILVGLIALIYAITVMKMGMPPV